MYRARTSHGWRALIVYRRRREGFRPPALNRPAEGKASRLVPSKRFENVTLRTLRADLTTGISTAMRRSEDTTGRNHRLRISLVSMRSRDWLKSFVNGSSGPAGVLRGRLVEGQVTSLRRPAAGRKPNEFPVIEGRAGSSRRSAAVPELRRRLELAVKRGDWDLWAGRHRALLWPLARRGSERCWAAFDPGGFCSEKHVLGAVSGALAMVPFSLITNGDLHCPAKRESRFRVTSWGSWVARTNQASANGAFQPKSVKAPHPRRGRIHLHSRNGKPHSSARPMERAVGARSLVVADLGLASLRPRLIWSAPLALNDSFFPIYAEMAALLRAARQMPRCAKLGGQAVVQRQRRVPTKCVKAPHPRRDRIHLHSQNGEPHSSARPMERAIGARSLVVADLGLASLRPRLVCGTRRWR